MSLSAGFMLFETFVQVRLTRGSWRWHSSDSPPLRVSLPAVTFQVYVPTKVHADGHTDRVIARRLAVSQRTVEKHLENVRAKLGVRSRAAAVALWLEGPNLNG
jgi:hypothetical protein